jgi:predicted transcriptional regulator
MAKARKPKQPLTLSKQLQAAIADSGLTVYAIAKGAEIQQTTLMRFVSGERDMRMSNADAVAAFLGLELVKRKKR